MKSIIEDQYLTLGLVLVGISTLLFGIMELFPQPDSGLFPPSFFFHYILALIYFFILWGHHKARFFYFFTSSVRAHHILLLCLFNLSAYSLNRTIAVFHESVPWLTIFLLVEGAALICYALFSNRKEALDNLLTPVFVAALAFNLYQCIMIIPYLSLGLMAFLFLGISLHILVPFFFVWALIAVLRSLISTRAQWILSGSTLVLIFAVVSIQVHQWSQANHTISQEKFDRQVPGNTDELPDWIVIAQKLSDSPFTEKFLKSDLVYQQFTTYDNFLWPSGGFNFEEIKKHDPLVAVAGYFGGKNELDENTRIKILNYLFDSRHQTTDRFWSGENLSTKSLTSNIQLFPDFRLAFTELIMTIRNDRYQKSRWRRQQEAIYTFQLPEGGVITSLSLWIAGQEEKARLTTKSKAQQAYNTIVGREVRDPSVVYWMEGNQIRVRVFPCTPEEDRQFKLGITTPLTYHEGKLVYQSITFKGPSTTKTNTRINLLTPPDAPISGDLSFQREADLLTWQGDYPHAFSLEMDAPPLESTSFRFGEDIYELEDHKLQFKAFNPQEIYLDLSTAWSVAELESIADQFGDRITFLNGFGLHKATKETLKKQIHNLSKPNFTLFPFQKLTNPQTALIITKGNTATPNLSDLDKSQFKETLFAFFKDQTREITVYDLGTAPSDYIRSLKEFGVLRYASGSVEQLAAYLEKRRFPVSPQNKQEVHIPTSSTVIKKSNDLSTSVQAAPDHLMRLFEYGRIMQHLGRNYFEKDIITDSLLALAGRANVVTPVSSLIVLETQRDYERFGIEKSKDSLGNAAINSSGAVPEPHEWALIMIGLAFLGYVWIKRNKYSFSRC